MAIPAPSLKIKRILTTPGNGFYVRFVAPPIPPIPYCISTPASAFIFDETLGTITDFVGTETEICIPPTISGIPVTAIGDSAFQSNAFTDITFPHGLVTIGPYAFNVSPFLTSVNFSDTSIDLQEGAFSDLLTIKTMTIPNGVTNLPLVVLVEAVLMTHITLPSTINTVGDQVFRSCGLLDITFSSALTSIGSGVFSSCEALTGIYFEGDAPPEPNFSGAFNATVFYHATATGFTNPWANLPTATY